MSAPLGTIACVGAAFIGLLAVWLSVKEVGGLRRILDALRGRQPR